MTFAKIRLALMFSAEHDLPIELGSDEVITVLEKLDSLSAETGRAITRAEAAERRVKELEAEIADWKREYDVQQQRACDAEAKHKKLEAEYAELRQRYDALMNCYMLNEEPDGPVMVVDFGKVLVKHEAQLTTANAEIESMHRELDAKQAIIDEQKREINTAWSMARRFYAATLEARAECTELGMASTIIRGERPIRINLREYGDAE